MKKRHLKDSISFVLWFINILMFVLIIIINQNISINYIDINITYTSLFLNIILINKLILNKYASKYFKDEFINLI